MKTADQAPKQRHHNEYAPAPQTLSPVETDRLDDPIDIALFGSAEINLIQSIELLADVFNTHREEFIRNIYKKLDDPRRRLAFGFGIVFAEAFENFTATDPHWRNKANGRAFIPKGSLKMPVFGTDVDYEYGCVQYFLAQAMMANSDSIASIARQHDEPFESACIGIALVVAEKATLNAGVPNPDWFAGPIELFAIEMMVHWMDAIFEARLTSATEKLKQPTRSSLGRSPRNFRMVKA